MFLQLLLLNCANVGKELEASEAGSWWWWWLSGALLRVDFENLIQGAQLSKLDFYERSVVLSLVASSFSSFPFLCVPLFDKLKYAHDEGSGLMSLFTRKST